MTPQELNKHLLKRLVEAGIVVNQMNISMGIMTKVVNDLLPLVTDVNKMESLKKELDKLATHYKSGHDFGQILLEEMKKLKTMI